METPRDPRQSGKPRRSRIRRVITFLIGNVLFTAVVACAALVYGWTGFAGSLPDLSGWHTSAPASEFVAKDAVPGYGLDDYLAQEGRVFDELRVLVDTKWSPTVGGAFSRYRTDSICNPERLLDRNWNRSLLLEAKSPVGGALLVHGLSDSPYSLRRIGQRLHELGWTVLWLRIPGHGACPKALAQATAGDWSAAVEVAARGLRSRLPTGAPMVLFGFSNGGALCTDYAAAALDDTSLPRADALVLFSPMIGITAAASITRLHSVVGTISGLEKVAWSKVDAEIDPFKYSSWPMNASVQAWAVTQQVEARLAKLQAAGRMGEFPPVLTFQSAVDSTVVVPEMIRRLFYRLSRPGSELVLFDVNRVDVGRDLISYHVEDQLIPLLDRPDLGFALAVVTNADPDTRAVKERRREGGSLSERPLGLAWPLRVFSLSHQAVPVPSDDPILGTAEATAATGLPLGSLDLRGETGVLEISESLMVRLRHNPFYSYVEDRTLSWLAGAVGTPEPPPAKAR